MDWSMSEETPVGVGEADWQFRTTFQLSPKDLSDPNADLVFDGLDTYCTVELNGKVILEANNMFLPYRVAVKKHLVEGSNELILTFPSTFVKGRELQEKHGKFALWNGDSSRLHVRTAQYTYGWDWGPILRTIGPWRPITLETYAIRLSDVRVRQDVKEDLSAELSVEFEVSEKTSDLSAAVVLKSSAGAVAKTADAEIKDGRAVAEFKLAKGDVELWYPVGYGKQALYTVDIQVSDKSGKQVAAHSQRIGIRRARVVEDPLEGQDGRTFLFEINNIRIFCGGSNWIPADNFLTTISAERYRAWLQLLVDGNQNMVRIWAGGIYEDDVFYDTCDELGILVWQDFMFGCGQYPAYDSLVDSVKLEAEANVKRMRHHPSLVIWAGNNEDYQVAESLKLDLDYNADPTKVDFRKTNFPARYIYEVVLPEIVNRLSDTHYHRASPYSGYGKPTTDRTYGDIHQWNVWHVTLAPNSSTELWKGGLPGEGKRTRDSDPQKVVVVQARLLGADGTVLARYSNWPEPFKFIHFPTPEQVGLKISTSKGESSEDTLVTLSTSIPIKGIILDVDGDEAKWSDQAIDLAPRDDQVVVVKGLKGRPVKARYLGDGSA
ncbi:hypothetical protein FS749_013657 [Ceratobasidium sp. UAMH 11750]|nr:hypothetical protein FS749_013657 [Ceratobasidium sp. UAMH 11750]